jgi:hypothetical protein
MINEFIRDPKWNLDIGLGAVKHYIFSKSIRKEVQGEEF